MIKIWAKRETKTSVSSEANLKVSLHPKIKLSIHASEGRIKSRNVFSLGCKHRTTSKTDRVSLRLSVREHKVRPQVSKRNRQSVSEYTVRPAKISASHNMEYSSLKHGA